ncbi:hypothetical protein V2J09_023758 [Rumex salicifolius]
MVLSRKHKGQRPDGFSAKMTSFKQLALRKFVEDYGNKLSNFAFLHVPGGKDWPVEVSNRNGDVSFYIGWKNFAENYSIERDSLLIFRFREISLPSRAWRFQVRIFQPNGLEMDYFSNTSQNPTPSPEITEEETIVLEDSIEILRSGIQQQSDRLSKGPWLFKNHCQNPTFMAEIKRRNTINNFEMTDSAHKTYDVHVFRVSDQQKQKSSVNDDIPTETSGKAKAYKLYVAEEDTDLKNKAKAFLDESPGFIKCMTKSDVDYARPVVYIYKLTISSSFMQNMLICFMVLLCLVWLPVPTLHSERYMKVNDNADLNAIVIKGEGGKTWKVKYHLDASYPRLGAGWTQFRSDNCLEIGDVCAFKLINRSKKVYEVAIFRVNAK